MMVTNGIMIIINFLLNITLIPLIGITGAAIATTVSLLGGTVFNFLLITKYLEMKIDLLWYLKFFSFTLVGMIVYIFGSKIIDSAFLGVFSISILIIIIYQLLLTDVDKKNIKTMICSLKEGI